MVFKSGIIPDGWTIGIINPIYKNKGNVSDPENYRPITLLSYLNNRLLKYVENYDIISKYQTGFRPTFSTVDNMFVFRMLIDLIFVQFKEKVIFVHV